MGCIFRSRDPRHVGQIVFCSGFYFYYWQLLRQAFAYLFCVVQLEIVCVCMCVCVCVCVYMSMYVCVGGELRDFDKRYMDRQRSDIQ